MKKILLIVNPLAGGKNKNKILDTVCGTLAGEDVAVETIFTEYAGHAVELARNSDADITVGIGGDGTQNEVARGLLESGRAGTMGIIPCGSGDGLALHLGISRDPREAALTLVGGTPATIDHGLVNGRPFLCTTGVGLDAIVSWRFARSGSRGLLTYVRESVRTWFGFRPEHYTVIVDGQKLWDAPATFVTVANAGQWGNNAWVAPRASVRDGLLDVTLVKPFHTWHFPALLFRMMRRTADGSPHVVCLRGREIEIRRMEGGPFHFDGDPGTIGKELRMSMVPHSLSVMVPSAMKEKI